MGASQTNAYYPYNKESKLIVSGFCHRYRCPETFPIDILSIIYQYYGSSIIDILYRQDNNTTRNFGTYSTEKLIHKIFKSSNSHQYYAEYTKYRSTLWKIIFLQQYIDPYPNYHINQKEYNNKLSLCPQDYGVVADTDRWLHGYCQGPTNLSLNKQSIKNIHNMFISNYKDIEQSYYWNGNVYLTLILCNVFNYDEYTCYLCLASLLLRIYPTYHSHHTNKIMKQLREKYSDSLPSSQGGLFCAFQLINELLEICDKSVSLFMKKVGITSSWYIFSARFFLFNTFKDPLIVWDFLLLNGIGYIVIIVVVLLIDKRNGVTAQLKDKNLTLKDASMEDLTLILTDIFSRKWSMDFRSFIPNIYKISNEVQRKYCKLWYEIMNHATDMKLVKNILPRFIESNAKYGDPGTGGPDFSQQPARADNFM